MSREKIDIIFDWFVSLARARNSTYAPCNFSPLVVGPSGSGKTYGIQQAVEQASVDLGSPILMIKVDATAYTAHGWEGSYLEDLIYEQAEEFRNAYAPKSCVADLLEHTDGTVIFIDEIDKILMPMGSDRTQAWQQSQQFDLLKLLDRNAVLNLNNGRKYSTSSVRPINCDNIMWIFGGAFEPLFKYKLEQSNKSIGFSASPKSVNQQTLFEQELTWKDFEAFGAVPELLNRMGPLIQLRPHTEDEMRAIYQNSYDVSIVNNLFGKPLTEEQAIEAMRKTKMGARAIAREAYENALRTSVRRK